MERSFQNRPRLSFACWRQGLRALLAHPLTAGLDLDDPATTELRRRIIDSKPLLKRIYEDWCGIIRSGLVEDWPILELGSGAGFMEKRIAGLVTSEVFFCRNVSIVANALALPFPPRTLNAIVMVDVLHHIPDVTRFFAEADRCLRDGGRICMIEPWVSGWSKFVYTKLHHEPFLPDASEWAFPSTGPLSGANGALPWILFERDRGIFEKEFPRFEIVAVNPMMPFRYLLSGGVSMRGLIPGFADPLIKALETAVSPWMKHWAMFAFIVLRKRTAT